MSLCIGCMHEIGSEIICPNCGFDNAQTQSAPFLPYGAVLDKRYVIGKNIETNGESTMYIGFDRQISKPVLIREFLPAGFYSREEGSVKLLIDPEKKETYTRLLSDFEQYFSFLSTLREMSAMNVITDIFRANNTCYVVEEYEELITFEEYVQRNNGHLEWEVARPLFMPVVSLLEALHKNGYGHYAISPTNLYITTSGKALLLGFATINERRRGTPLKSQLFTGCAAPEQYEKSFLIDNITDIYGFTATLFYALTGSLPGDARQRLTDGALLMSTSTVKRLPPHVVTALANGLQVKREDRIIDFGDLRSQLSVAPTVKAIQEEISRTASMASTVKPPKKKFGMSPISVGIIVTVVATLLFLWIGLLIVDQTTGQSNNEETFEDESVISTTVDPFAGSDWKGEVLGNILGRDYEEVVSELQRKGITVRNSGEGYSDKYKEGTIMEQSLPENTPLDAEGGLIVVVKISKGAGKAELPEIEGETIESALMILSEAGFNNVKCRVSSADDQMYNYDDLLDNYIVAKYAGDLEAGEEYDITSAITVEVTMVKPAEPTDTETTVTE